MGGLSGCISNIQGERDHVLNLPSKEILTPHKVVDHIVFKVTDKVIKVIGWQGHYDHWQGQYSHSQ